MYKSIVQTPCWITAGRFCLEDLSGLSHNVDRGCSDVHQPLTVPVNTVQTGAYLKVPSLWAAPPC